MAQKKYTILLVEDDADVAEMLLEELEYTGRFRVFHAKSGTEAYARAFNVNVDLIITDYRMPVMNGGQFIDLIQTSPRLSAIPVIFLSGAIEEAKAHMKDQPMIAFLSKPIESSVLIKTATDLIEKRQVIEISKQEIDVKILNAFIESTVSVLKTMAATDKCIPGKPSLVTANNEHKFDAMGIIQISSTSFNGAFILAFPQQTLFALRERILREKTTELTKEVADTAGELLNIIWTKTKAQLQNNKYEFKSGLPTVVWGSTKAELGIGPSVIVPTQTDCGEFYIKFFLKADVQKLKV